MNKSLFLFLVIAACNNVSDSTFKENDFIYSDTILLANNGLFYSCCKVFSSDIILFFQKTPEITNFNSTGGGGTLYKQYRIEDSLFVRFQYVSYPVYDADILDYMLYCRASVQNCLNSNVVENGVYKSVRMHCADSTVVCMGISYFDGKGYTFINVEDFRSISNGSKEAFADEFLSTVIKKDTVFVLSNTVNGQLDTNRFASYEYNILGQVKINDTANEEELFIAVQVDAFENCAEVHSVADQIIWKNSLSAKIKLITMVMPATKSEFKRLASFVVRNNTDTMMSDFEGFDGTLNYADCIWIDESFADKPLIQENCDRWKKGM